MMPTAPVTFTTPDGVERLLRFTLGARKRIAEMLCAGSLIEVLNRYGDGALPTIAYAMMYDAHGDPPAGLVLADFAESVDDAPPLMAAIMSAASKGRIPKNELEAQLRKAAEMEATKLIGSLSGALPGSVSEFQPPNSGGAPTANSTLSASDTASSSDSPDTAPV